MKDGALILDLTREGQSLKVSVYARGEGVERTLRPYEIHEVPWEKVDLGCLEIIHLLGRSTRSSKPFLEVLGSLKKSGQLLFDFLLPSKAKERLAGTTAQTLTLHLDDGLVHIPWELLHNGRDFLCRRFAIGRIARTRQSPTARSMRSLHAPFKVLILADPRGDLEASYQEGLEIRNFLDERSDVFHVDFKSSPVDVAFVKKNLRDYDIVHYAGHANYQTENPGESGWLLNDGSLIASDISAMGGLQPMPAMVFSNACQSGQTEEWKIKEGYGQKVFGLANAFLLSGVQHYIGTFWDIVDEPSRYFAKCFYSSVADGDDVGTALLKARHAVSDRHGEQSLVWSSYMLYGDPSFAFSSQETRPRLAFVQEPPPIEQTQATRGSSIATAVSATPKPRLNLGYTALGVLALAIIAIAAWQFYPRTDQGQQYVLPQVKNESPSQPSPERLPAAEQASVSEPAPAEKLIRKEDKKPPATRATKELATAGPRLTKSTPEPAAATKQPAVSPPANAEQLALNKEPPPGAAIAPLSLSMNIIGQRKEPDGSYTEVLVSEGSVLRSRDNFQVHLEVNRPSYVYVLIYDSQGRAEQLFPDAKIDHPEFIQTGRNVVIPRRDLWFWLDDHTGTETIYVLASEKPMNDIRGLLAKMAGGDDSGKKNVSQEIKRQITIMQRGVGGVTKGQAVTYTLSDGKKIQKVTDVVTGTGSIVRAVSFQHR
jgi:hypothetical protein